VRERERERERVRERERERENVFPPAQNPEVPLIFSSVHNLHFS
jgi:hypothetical protein